MDRITYLYTDGHGTLSVHPCSIVSEDSEQNMFVVVIDEYGTKSFLDDAEAGFDPQEWLMQYKLDNWAKKHSDEIIVLETIANDIEYAGSKFSSPQ